MGSYDSAETGSCWGCGRFWQSPLQHWLPRSIPRTTEPYRGLSGVTRIERRGRMEGEKGERGRGREEGRTENKVLKTFLNNQVSSLHLLNTRLRKSYWAENWVRCWACGARQVRPTTRPHGDYIIVRNLSASEKSNPIKKMVVKLCSTKQTMFRNSVLQKKS